MSQFPHDEFDDVAPYQSDEVGKHRAPAEPVAARAPGGGLKWIGLLVVAVLLVGAVAWFVTRGDDEDPLAEDDNGEEIAEEQPEGDGEGEGDNGEEGTDGEGNGDGEATDDDGQDPLAADFEVRAVNAGAPDGSAGQLTAELEELGVTTGQSIDWDSAWGNPNTPQVVYTDSEQEEFAQALANELGIDNVNQSDSWQTIVVIIGSEYQ